jgi:hypothetical protein
MAQESFAARYRAAERLAGADPIEAGLLGRLADFECRHGRLAFDRAPACGCWPEEGAIVHALAPARESPRRRRAARATA